MLNLEVWTFTSAQTEKEAERSDMMLHFARESFRASSVSGSLHDLSQIILDLYIQLVAKILIRTNSTAELDITRMILIVLQQVIRI